MSGTGWKQSLLQRIAGGIESISERYPRGYLLMASAFALAGYGWLLLFPWLVLAGISGGYEALTGRPSIVWVHVLLWSAVTAGAALVTWRLARFRPALPPGIAVHGKQVPALFDLIGELVRHYRCPGIDRVVFTGAFELELVKTPRRALPAWPVNTLLIGLPLIRSVSPVQFRCLLARRLGQFSKRYNPLENWLCGLRRIWPQYRTVTGEDFPGLQPVRWFFSVYAPLYELISVPAARLDELAADSYAMEVCSDEEVRDAITMETVCRLYLEEKYWPVYRQLSANVRQAMPKPHAGMVSVLRAVLKEDQARLWLRNAMQREPRRDEPVPSLARRLDNIGCLKTRIGELAAIPAADVYLGPATGALDKALGQALPAVTAQPGGNDSFSCVLRLFTAPLVRLSGRRQVRGDASPADRHSRLPSLQ